MRRAGETSQDAPVEREFAGGSAALDAPSQYWRKYFGAIYDVGLLSEFASVAKQRSFGPASDPRCYDWLPSANNQAPIVVIVPGSIAYGRLFAAMAALLVREGFAAALFDYQGTRVGPGECADFSVLDHIDGIVELLHALRASHPSRPLVLFGLSYGGYMSFLASRRVPVDGLVWYAAPDPTSRAFVRSQPGFSLLVPLLSFVAKLLPRLPVALDKLVDYDKVSSSEEFLRVYKGDPNVVVRCTLRSLVSIFKDFDSDHDLEKLTEPLLMMHRASDRLFDSSLGLEAFARVGSTTKRFIEVPGSGHWPATTEELREVTAAAARFVRQHVSRADEVCEVGQ